MEFGPLQSSLQIDALVHVDRQKVTDVLYAVAIVGCRKLTKQESPAIADKSARRESMPKIAPIRRAYNVVADNTGLSSCV